MSTTKTSTKPLAEMPKAYRLRYPDDSFPLQTVARYLNLRILKKQQYTTADGIPNLRITYELNKIVKTAENLDEYGTMLAGELAIKVMNWRPNLGIVVLSQQLTMMKQCDPSVTVDMDKIPSASFDTRLSHFIQKADMNGFGLSIDGELVEIRPIIKTADIAERMGMKFVPG